MTAKLTQRGGTEGEGVAKKGSAKPVQHHPRSEACPQQVVQRAVEVIMGLRLPDDADPLLRGHVPVLPDSHREGYSPVALVIVALNQERSPVCIEAGVWDREYKMTSGLE